MQSIRKSVVRIGRSLRLLALLLAISLLGGQAWGESGAVPGEFLVKLKRPINAKSVKQASQAVGADVIDIVRKDVLLVRKPSSASDDRYVISLESNPLIELVEPNLIYRFVRLPDDPELGRLWGLKNTGEPDSEGTRGVADVDIGAERAWTIQTGSKNVVVAVIDTGIDYTHPDLKDNVWVNEAELDGLPGVDDDSNGYIDDVHGMDFVQNDGDPMDDNGHGSHCGGTIGAKGNDGKGLVGVAWDVTLVGVKFLDANGGGTLANAIKSIDYATRIGVDIMSNSWGGGGFSQLLKESIERARDAGILFVAAAGNSSNDNDRSPEYPAGYEVDNVVSVAAIDNRGELASFSSFGQRTVHVAAPGVNILSAIPGGMDTYSGTSMATPHVSGVAALLMTEFSSMNYLDVKARMIRTAKPLASLKGRVASAGLVDAHYALIDRTPPPDPNDPANWSGLRAETISTPHPYPENYTNSWTITVPGAKRLAVRFSRFDTERGYDKVEFLDATGASYGTLSGRNDGRFSPVITGDTIVVKFASDHTVNRYGFDIDAVAYEE